MKILIYILFSILSAGTFAEEFGDLIPKPILGNTWKVYTVEEDREVLIEIIEIDRNSVTTKMTSKSYDTIHKTNYVIKDGVCFIESIESRGESSGNYSNFKRSFSPILKCTIGFNKMPYKREYIANDIDLETGESDSESRTQTYIFHGVESIETPAGVFRAEKIEVQDNKMHRVLWRNDKNSLIKHQVDFFNSGEKTTTLLIDGSSQ